MLEAVWIAFAFTLGLLVRAVGLPPLIGYLAAGFAISAASPYLHLPEDNGVVLGHVAHLGVLLLLFTVGLKLKARSLLRPEVIGGGLAHFTVSALVLAPALLWALDISTKTAVLLAIALSFSSTVLAAKVLETKRELRAFHGRVAIGILVVQDLIALAVIAFTSGDVPSAWALGVLALPLLRPLLYKLLDNTGRDELLVLLGLLLALVIGGHGFEMVGLSSELGALALGALLANHRRATELSQSLWSIKEVLLVGFFLQIGMGGLPDGQALMFALVMALLLPLKGILFYLLLLLFKLRARSAFLSSVSLANYSEFGLIVASVALPEWLIPLALAVALSFVISAQVNRFAHPLYERLARFLTPLERNTRHPDEQPVSLGGAEILIMGMGRTGTSAYDHLQETGLALIAMDSDPNKVAQHRDVGRNILFGDAEDQLFWQSLEMPRLKAAMLTMSDSEAKIIAARQLRKRGFTGYVISHTLYADEAKMINAAGTDETYLTMSEAGKGLADHVQEQLGTSG